MIASISALLEAEVFPSTVIVNVDIGGIHLEEVHVPTCCGSVPVQSDLFVITFVVPVVSLHSGHVKLRGHQRLQLGGGHVEVSQDDGLVLVADGVAPARFP